MFFRDNGLRTFQDAPFEGTYVPMRFLHADARVISIMIEVNRALYMNEHSGARSDSFNDTKNVIRGMVYHLIDSGILTEGKAGVLSYELG